MRQPRQLLKRAVNTLLLPLGVELRRRPKLDTSWYQPPISCQIQRLGHLYEMAFGRRADGFFVDVGAFHPTVLSNTSCLAEKGWSGVLVEPIPAHAALCRQHYAQRTDIVVVEAAAGSSSGFIDLHMSGPLTTSNPDLQEEYRRSRVARRYLTEQIVSVGTRTLDEILTDVCAPDAFEVLSVDTEGTEQEVFGGFDLRRWRPAMMIVEVSDIHPDLVATRAPDYRLSQDIQASGYEIVYKDAINTIYLRHDVSQDRFR